MEKIDAIINSRRKNKHQYDLTVKEGWGNHHLVGSLKNQKIVRRNASNRLELNDNNISIFNRQCHPFLEAALTSIGAFINNDDTQINYSDIFFKFYGISQVPNDQIIKEIYEVSKKIKSKFKITYSPKVSIDRFNFFCHNKRVCNTS